MAKRNYLVEGLSGVGKSLVYEEPIRHGSDLRGPQARLVILPATAHLSISAVAQVLEPMITAFRDDVPPANPSLW
jgi:hypothetical protein